jgi:hypothetical protein
MSKKTETQKEPKAPKNTKAAPKISDKIVKLECVRRLPCKLDPKELAKLGQDLCTTLDKIDAIEAQKKSANEQFKADTSLLEESLTVLRDRQRSKAEERDVKCIQETDYRAAEIRVKRLDTGEVFSKRTMNREELQLPLDAQKPAGKLIPMDGGKGKPTERKQPKPNDVIDVETRAGWKRGKVLPSSGSVLDVDVGDGKIEHAPVDGQTWRWPDEVGENSAPVVEKGDPLTAKLGDVAAQHAKNKAEASADANDKPAEEGDGHPEVEKALETRGKGKKKYKGLGAEVDINPPEGCDF